MQMISALHPRSYLSRKLRPHSPVLSAALSYTMQPTLAKPKSMPSTYGTGKLKISGYGKRLEYMPKPVYFGVTLGRSVVYRRTTLQRLKLQSDQPK